MSLARDRLLDSFFDILKGSGPLFENSYVIADYNLPDYPLVYVNDAFMKLTGFTNEEDVLNKNCRFLQGENSDLITVREISRCIKSKESGWFDILNYKKNGDEFWNRLTLFPIGDELGSIDYYLGIQQDVSDLKLTHNANNNYGPLKAIGQELTESIRSILNASRSLKYFDDGSHEANKKIQELIITSKKEVAKIANYVRTLE